MSPLDLSFWLTPLYQYAELVRSFGLGVGGLVAAWIAIKALNLNSRRTNNDTKRLDNEAARLRQQAQALENDRTRLVNDTYVKAVEQLGHDKMEVRLGAIYALERIARDAEDFDLHWSIMETLCAYVRERPASEWARKKPTTEDESDAIAIIPAAEECPPTEGAEPVKPILRHPPTDIAAVFTVLKRRSDARKRDEAQQDLRLDLRRIDLSHAILDGIELERADLSDANLWVSDLVGAKLRGAVLHRACLRSADLRDADVQSADMTDAKLQKAIFIVKDMRTSILTDAHLDGTVFGRSNAGLEYLHERGAFWDEMRPPKGVPKPH